MDLFPELLKPYTKPLQSKAYPDFHTCLLFIWMPDFCSPEQHNHEGLCAHWCDNIFLKNRPSVSICDPRSMESVLIATEVLLCRPASIQTQRFPIQLPQQAFRPN